MNPDDLCTCGHARDDHDDVLGCTAEASSYLVRDVVDTVLCGCLLFVPLEEGSA